MQIILIILAFLLTLNYAGLLWVFLRGSTKLKQLARHTHKAPSVSVVVPLRNEEQYAEATLMALQAQDFLGEWEVICVNDRSSDGTLGILEKFCAAHPHFSFTNIPPSAPPIPSPKKRALAAGFALAKGEILMTTDADCLPPPHWLSSMTQCFLPDIGIVQGPKRIAGNDSLLSRYQETEVFGLVSIEAATFALGQPMIASAPSLAYRKALYEKAGGFSGLDQYVSGDDDLLVHKMKKFSEYKILYNPDAQACVTTPPASTWKELFQQRARWASNGAHYDDKGFVALLCGIYGFYLWLLFAPILAMAQIIPWSAWIIPLFIKIGLNGLFLRRTAKILGQGKAMRNFFWAELLHIPITVLVVPMGHLGWYKWK